MANKLRFKGLDVADETFERSSEHCSSCVSDTCGTRDCNLEVITLGDGKGRILSGGLCPKGNTDDFMRRAPDYVEIYRKILDRHLEEVTVPLEQKEGEKVLIPRSLTFLNERGVFYSALYDALCFDVSISLRSNDEISDLGKLCAHSESCYPVILAHGHAAFLKKEMRSGLDKLLLVNVFGASDGDKETKFCPYVASGGYVINGNIRVDDADALLPDIWFDDSAHLLHRSVAEDLRRVFGNRFSEEHVRYAVSVAQGKHDSFLSAVHKQGERIVGNLLKRGKTVFMGIGRGYTVLDDKASSKVHELFAANGLHFVPSFFLPPREGSIEDVVENMFWLQGVRMIGDTLRVVQTPGVVPVRESNFNCGPDSFNLLHEKRIRDVSGVPGLVMETDGHNSNAQFGTRIKAFNEVIVNFDEVKRIVSRKSFVVTKPVIDDLRDRIIGVPYMGDVVDIMVAAFETVGLKAEAMPCRTEESKAFAQKYVTTNTCRPFAFQVGDHLAWLDSLREREGHGS